MITGRHTGPDDELPPLDDLMQRFLESPPAVLVHREHTGGFFFNQGDGFHSRPPNDTDEGHNGLLELAMQIARTHWPEWEEMLSRAGVPALPVSPSFVRTELSSTPEG